MPELMDTSEKEDLERYDPTNIRGPVAQYYLLSGKNSESSSTSDKEVQQEEDSMFSELCNAVGGENWETVKTKWQKRAEKRPREIS